MKKIIIILAITGSAFAGFGINGTSAEPALYANYSLPQWRDCVTNLTFDTVVSATNYARYLKYKVKSITNGADMWRVTFSISVDTSGTPGNFNIYISGWVAKNISLQGGTVANGILNDSQCVAYPNDNRIYVNSPGASSANFWIYADFECESEPFN